MSDRPLQLLLIDEDPIFRLGFSTALAEQEGLAITIVATLGAIADLRSLDPGVINTIDVMVLALTAGDPSDINEQLSRCIGLKRQYPQVPMFALGQQLAPQSLVALQAAGIEGYGSKGMAIADLVADIEHVAAGETAWSILGELTDATSPARRSRPFAIQRRNWLFRQRELGLRQIEAELVQIETYTAHAEHISLWNDWYWTGRCRELRAARWLVNQLLPMEVFVVSSPGSDVASRLSSLTETLGQNGSLVRREDTRLEGTEALSSTQERIATPATQVLSGTLAAIQGSVTNLTGLPYAIDILQPERQQELLYAVLNQIRKMLDELRFLQVSIEQLPDKRAAILRDLWQSATLDFFSTYYTPLAPQRQQRLVDLLVETSTTIESEMLDKIPLVPELLLYLLFEQPLVIDTVAYRPEAPEAIARAQLILQNLTVQIANASMQMILNRFYDEEVIKKALFAPQYLSSREMARFRNRLVWRDRKQRYFGEPKAIFESQYHLLSFSATGLKPHVIYAPRQTELNQLTGIPWFITISWETRDAIAPLLQSIVTFVGDGLVYVLTKVVGRGLGLIGRGIMQGLGNTFQNPRSERSK